MVGCAASWFGGGSDDSDSVALCRERRRLLKAAVERRYNLAAAHAACAHSLNGVAAAIDVFVSRHFAPHRHPSRASRPTTSHFPLLPSPPAFLRHTLSEAKEESSERLRGASISSPLDSSSGYEEEGAVEEATGLAEAEQAERTKTAAEYECFFSAASTMPASPSSDLFGWDFFNPFDWMPPASEATVPSQSSDEDLRLLREEEGIPDLEQTEEEVECRRQFKNSEKV